MQRGVSDILIGFEKLYCFKLLNSIFRQFFRLIGKIAYFVEYRLPSNLCLVCATSKPLLCTPLLTWLNLLEIRMILNISFSRFIDKRSGKFVLPRKKQILNFCSSFFVFYLLSFRAFIFRIYVILSLCHRFVMNSKKLESISHLSLLYKPT